MSDDRRDRAFDEQVRAALAVPREAGVCPDAETLALYASQALAEEERAGVEPHLSLCARCQDVLAVLATTEEVVPLGSVVAVVGSGLESDASLSRPDPTAAPTPWWRSRWLLPVPAAALAAALYFAVRPPAPPAAPPAFEMAARDVGSPTGAVIEPPARTGEPEQPFAAAPPPIGSGGIAGEPATTAPRAPARDTERRAKAVAADEFGAKAAEADAPVSLAPPRERPSAQMVARNEAPREVPAAVVDARRDARDAPAAVRQEALAAPSTSKATTDAGKAAAGSAQRGVVAEALPDARASIPAGLARGRAGGGPAGSLLLPSPDEARFTIDVNGRLFSSPDLGRTWQPVVLPRPAILTTGQCAASASPGEPRPCWVAGRHGVVLRTIDGTTWHAVASPTARDIVTLTTSASERAVLTTADGVRFETTDGGTTWRER